MMAVAKTLMLLGQTDRDLFLFDTFAGMPEPSSRDGVSKQVYQQKKRQDADNAWCYASIGTVKENLYRTGYPAERIHFVQGAVEDTLPSAAPDSISLLRLDTDWYESSLHELVHLYPRLTHGGILILDDYGHWESCKRAVDEYFESGGDPFFLARIDYTARIGVKPQPRAAA